VHAEFADAAGRRNVFDNMDIGFRHRVAMPLMAASSNCVKTLRTVTRSPGRQANDSPTQDVMQMRSRSAPIMTPWLGEEIQEIQTIDLG
jgi:hypothetical protein